MRPITVTLIVLALMGAAGAGFMGKRVIERSARETAAKHEMSKRDVEVLVAAKDMLQGHGLKEAELRWDLWPQVTAEATKVVIRQPGTATLAHLPGTVLRRPMVAGEPVTAASVFAPGKAGLMPNLIAPGKKAIGIQVTAASAASGFVLPGDIVDIMLTMDLSRVRSNGAAQGGPRIVAETILTGVKVLGVDQEIVPGGAPSRSAKKGAKKKEKPPEDGTSEVPADVAMLAKTIAIEVTAEQAERVLAAQAVGRLSLALRSLAEGTEDEQRSVPYISEFDVSKALQGGVKAGGVRIIRGGQVSQ